MSKLDGNERWTTKMLMHEHAEQYNGRGDKQTGGRATPEELVMIRDSILLPHLLTMVQRNVSEIEGKGGFLRHLYKTAGQALIDRISKDTYDLKRKLKQANIKILGDETDDVTMFYAYNCRGYQEKLGIVREVMKAEMSIRLGKYIAELEALMKVTKKE
jgi:hypothetical protein